MLVSVGSVTLLLAWCIIKVLKSPAEAEQHDLDRETPKDLSKN